MFPYSLSHCCVTMYSHSGRRQVTRVHGAGFANSSDLNAASIANYNFGKRKSWKVDGAVYAQPLYAPGMRLAPVHCTLWNTQL